MPSTLDSFTDNSYMIFRNHTFAFVSLGPVVNRVLVQLLYLYKSEIMIFFILPYRYRCITLRPAQYYTPVLLSCILLAQREVASFMSFSYVLSMKKTSMLIGHFWPMDFSICFLAAIECLARLPPRIMGRSAVIAVALLGLASVAVASQVVAFGDSWGSFSRTFYFLFFSSYFWRLFR